MPRLWTRTIKAHRREVRDAILDATAALITRHGLHSITMLQIAKRAGIGRATLYKYFSEVAAILAAWHERHVTTHLEQLAQIRSQPGQAIERLKKVLETYAHISREHDGTQLSTLLHRGDHVTRAERQLRAIMQDLLTEAAKAGDVRNDIPATELASYCLYALAGASNLSSGTAVRRLVIVILAGLRAASGKAR